YNEQLLSDGPLLPFRTEQGDYWTSSQAQFLHDPSVHYSFPEFKGIKGRSKLPRHFKSVPRLAKGLHAWEHLPVPNKEDPAMQTDHTIISHYRTFAVHVKLLEHAYNHSYSF
ncbi:uncharacterized protein F5147DRAFT_816252, partial [Suillus discolor]